MNKSPKFARKSFDRQVRPLLQTGLTHSKIAEQLTTEGVTSPTGRPLQRVHVSAAALRMGLRRRRSRSDKRRAVSQKSAPHLKTIPALIKAPNIVLDVLTDPKLTDKKKIWMLTAYFN